MMKRVLVVDDSASETLDLSLMLNRNGYEVMLAESGEEGLKLAKEEMPDLVLMDIVMSGINGFQATRKLTKDPETNDIPVIMVTIKNQESDREWSKMQGASGFLVKPVPEAELINMIETVLDNA